MRAAEEAVASTLGAQKGALLAVEEGRAAGEAEL